MVAFTPIYGLPYMQGSDPPCFGPGTGCDNLESVFCDFAELVEAQLDENDAIIGRTATSIPMAQVRSVFPEGTLLDDVLTSDLPVTFDEVVFDTDNMVDTSTGSIQGITPRRNGIYQLYGEVALEALDPTDAGRHKEWEIRMGTETNIIHLATVNTGVAAGGTFYYAASLYAFNDTTPNPRTVFLQPISLYQPTTLALSWKLTAFWHGDL